MLENIGPMELEELIQCLVREPKTRRALDDSIAEAVGWERVYEDLFDDATGQITSVQLKKWHPPGSENLKRVPSFTTDLQVALDFVAEVAPDRILGFSWGNEEPAHAVLKDGPTVRAATVPMALCAVAMLHLRAKRKAIGGLA